MLRTIFFALAVSAAFAQLQTTVRPSSLSSAQPSIPEVPTIQEILLTGASREFRKIVKGDWRREATTFKSYLENAASRQPLSYWHDVPMFFDEAGKIYNMIVEIPRGEATKTLLNISEPMNPIDVVMNPETHEPELENVDYIHNFGKLPQTYVDPKIDEEFNLQGTGKPLDVVEISDRTHAIGDIVPVKMLGALLVEDSGMVDYKLIALDSRSEISELIHTLADVETHYPDLLAATRGYFRFYKFPGQINQVLNNGEYQEAAKAHELINKKHADWQTLIRNPSAPEEVAIESHVEGAAKPANDEAWRAILAA
jgi:inorganic pyrophosphatase